MNLFHFVTNTVQDTWTLFATHPVVTVPGLIVLVGVMVLVGHKNRVHN